MASDYGEPGGVSIEGAAKCRCSAPDVWSQHGGTGEMTDIGPARNSGVVWPAGKPAKVS